MSKQYYTMVKASPGFWGKIILKEIDEASNIEILGTDPDIIIITSTNRNALGRIIALSKKYPEEVFHVRIEGDNVYENYVAQHECSNGKSRLIKEGFEYCFCIKGSDRDKLDKGVLDSFKKEVTDFFKILEQKSRIYLNPGQNFEDIWYEEYDTNLLLTLEYITKKTRLTAKKYGKTYINVDVDFFDKTEILHDKEMRIQVT